MARLSSSRRIRTDEVIGCAGIIMQALARGIGAKVVVMTSGDGYPAAAAGVSRKPLDQIGPEDFLTLSRLRQTQSRNTCEILGVKGDDLILLGYPNGDLNQLYDSADEKVIRHQFIQKNKTYALIQKDYHTAMHGTPAPYSHAALLGDLVELLTTWQPAAIYVTDETDGHLDHRAAFRFLRDAAQKTKYQGDFYTYLVHGLPAWPFPPGITPDHANHRFLEEFIRRLLRLIPGHELQLQQMERQHAQQANQRF
ncbi:MAG: PIG-L family deacetylase, partial [Phycisphaerales bacterium]|nr:PIG-L family deacetylase [Phycisphaerales bacterium]